MGRDFLAGKSFDVGDFEQDLRDVWNFQFEIEQKYMPGNAYATPASTSFPGLTPGQESRSFPAADGSRPTRAQTYREMLIDEGVNSNQRV